MIIAIDPGKSTGWAVFNGDAKGKGTLQSCGITPHMRDVSWGGATAAVIELPKSRHDTPNPNSLITLAVRIGEYKCLLEREQVKVELFFPEEWKGQLPKDVCWRRSLAKLYPGELEAVTRGKKGHKKVDDLEDAVALGLWFVGR